jgi:hypothetical protein
MLLDEIKRGLARVPVAFKRRINLFFTRHMNPARIFLLSALGLFAGSLGIAICYDNAMERHFEHMSAAEHLERARAACGIHGEDATNCSDPDEAFRQLWAISKSSKEYSIASSFITSLQQQHVRLAAEAAAKSAQLRSQAFEQMQRNVNGESHDAFTCANSTENTPIMSFNGGNDWWKDDGRCAGQLQRTRDSDAQIYSYWPTTLRVSTDIDSFWLPGEERTCQTYPDNKGKVATVACTSTGTHQDHNIPVKFWGGVERNTISDWKCRREGDEFVCRAID